MASRRGRRGKKRDEGEGMVWKWFKETITNKNKKRKMKSNQARLAGDTSRAEAHQVGSGRPREGCLGGRRRGRERIDPVMEMGAIGIVRCGNLQ